MLYISHPGPEYETVKLSINVSLSQSKKKKTKAKVRNKELNGDYQGLRRGGKTVCWSKAQSSS